MGLVERTTRESNFCSDPVPAHPGALARSVGNRTRIGPAPRGRRNVTGEQLIGSTTDESIRERISGMRIYIAILHRGKTLREGIPLRCRKSAPNLTQVTCPRRGSK
jgi:hypothetical protein